MSPLQLVSSGLIPANDRSDGVGDTGGLELVLVLPKRMTRPGTTCAMEDRAIFNPPSANWGSGVVVVVGQDVVVLATDAALG